MSHYKRYPAYKDSELEWIGEIPEHWAIKPIKTIASCNDETLPDSIPPDTPIQYVDISAVSHDKGITDAEPMTFGDAPSRARRKARVGDVIVSTVRTYLKAVAFVDETHADCVYSTGFAVLRARREQLNPEYLKWLVLNELLIQAIESHSEGLSYPAIKASELVNLKSVVPSLPEQQHIASVLDHQTARIDALIAKKTRFIELLNEKHSALITHAVTKGLNANVKTKDSGVAWLGQVPEHWELLRAKRLFSERDERSTTGHEELLTVSHLTGVTPRVEKDVNMFEAETTEGYKICYAGDLVINTMWAWMGAMGTSRQTGLVSPSYNVYTPTHRLEPEFIDLLVRMPIFATEVRRFSKGIWSSRLRLYPEAFFEVELPVPPRIEQQTIVAKVRVETHRINALIEKTRRSIDLLKERRSALITAAVTGQIDVRRSV